MNGYLVLGLALAAFFFLIAKAMFWFLAWLYPELDKVHRDRLDGTISWLDEKPLFELGRLVLSPIVRRGQQLFLRWFVGSLLVIALSLALNAVVLTATLGGVIVSRFSTVSWGLDVTLYVIKEVGWFNFFQINGLVGILGAFFDLLSLAVTIELLRRASVATTVRSLVGHVGVDFIVAAISCMWSYAILDYTLKSNYDKYFGLINLFSVGKPHHHMGKTLWDTLRYNPGVWYVIIGLAVSAALPTIIYVGIWFVLFFLRIIPRKIQNFLSRVLFALTTDNVPVLERVGSLLGVLTAILTLLFTILKSWASL